MVAAVTVQKVQDMNIAELTAFIQEVELGHPHMTHETWKAYRAALRLVGNDGQEA